MPPFGPVCVHSVVPSQGRGTLLCLFSWLTYYSPSLLKQLWFLNELSWSVCGDQQCKCALLHKREFTFIKRERACFLVSDAV